jgi:hypothetical protein
MLAKEFSIANQQKVANYDDKLNNNKLETLLLK